MAFVKASRPVPPRDDTDRLGNTGSAAIWLALAQLRPTLKSGQTVLALGAEATDFMFGGFRYCHA